MYMKTINGIISTFLVLVLVTGCMPDSLTKFKENPVKDVPVTSGGTDEPDPCVEGSDPICTPPVDFAYPSTDLQYTIGTEVTDSLVPTVIGGLVGVEDYLSYSITPVPSTNPTLKNATGLNFNTKTGEISGFVTKYSPSTSQYLVTLKHTNPDDGTISTVGNPVTLTIATGSELKTLSLNVSVTCAAISGSCLAVGQQLNDLKYYDLTVGSVTPFSVNQKIISNLGTKGVITAIDSATKTLRVKLTNSKMGFGIGESLDNSLAATEPVYISPKATIADSVFTIVNSATYPDINYSITPTVGYGSALDTANGESSAILYLIAPPLSEQYAYDLDGDNAYDSGEVIPSPASLTGLFTIRTPTVGDTLSAREFTYSVYHSALKSSLSTNVKIKVEGVTGVVANGRIFYPTSDGDRLILDVASATNFAAGGNLTVNSSAAADPTYTVDYVYNNRIYATSNCGGICEDSVLAGQSVDNAATFVASETTITSAHIVRNNQISFSTIEPGLDTDLAQLNDERNMTFTIDPDISALDPKLKFQIKSECSNGSYITRSTCVGAGATWFAGGSIRAINNTPPFNIIAPQEFTISADTNDSRTVSTKLKFGMGEIPSALASTQMALLKVSNTTKFKEGDVITSSADGVARKGKGFVRRVFSTQKYIVVEIESGTFEDGDSLNNRLYIGASFGGELATINANGVTKFSSLLMLTDTAQNFAVNDQVTQGGNSGYVVFDFDDSGTEYVFVTTSSGNFATGTSISNGTVSKTVNNVLAVNVIVTAATTPGASFVLGGELAVADSAGTTHLASAYTNDLNGNDLYLTTRKGIIGFGNRVYSANPLDAARVAPSFVSVNTVAHEQAFYLYRGVDSAINLTSILGGTSGNQKYVVSPALPNGLSIPDETAGLIAGSALSASEKKNYTVTLMNDYGFESNSFDLEVIEYFEVKAITENTTYSTHKWGYGNARTSCRVTKAQIENATSTQDTDIICYIDANEGEINISGLKVDVNAGPDLCATMLHEPYFFENFPIVDTNETVIQFTGNTTDNACVVRFQQVDFNPAYAGSELPAFTRPNYQTLDITGPDKMCGGNYSQSISSDLPNCDIGSVKVIEMQAVASCSNPAFTDEASCIAGVGPGAWTCDITEADDSVTQCGGEISKCVDGGIDNVLSAANINNGIRSQQIGFSTGTTANKEYDYTLKASEFVTSSNVRMANYSSRYCGVANGYEAEFKKSVRYRDDLFAKGQNAYVYTCRDSANAPLARVHLYVREWNDKFTMANDIESFIPATLMDATGTDGFGVEINNNYDLDDYFFGSDTALNCAGATPVISGADVSDAGLSIDGKNGQQRVKLNAAATRNFYNIDGLGTSLIPGQKITIAGNDYVIMVIYDSSNLDVNIPLADDYAGAVPSFPQGYIYPLIGGR